MEMLLAIAVTIITVAILNWICLCVSLVKVKDEMKGEDIKWEL